ncbi:MAG: biotin--[acetyl-CoA-carboxylase] ligase [Aquisalinus sp.]|nr:biotin--[acetyl-CoA-carboxylase] ligase [Aquisalinus sp.]
MSTRLPSGNSIRLFEEIDSTSLEAKRQFDNGVSESTWFLTHHQTGGYGRQGRPWQQQPGNFAASLLLPISPKDSADKLALSSFACALAIAEAAEAFCVPSADLSLKWPNDVLLQGRKLSGLLLELMQQQDARALVIGIGVNLTYAPEVPEYPTACLAQLLKDSPIPTSEQFLEKLDERLQLLLMSLDKDGFAPIRAAWLARAANLGGSITVKLPKETLTGIFEGIDEAGALILRRDTTSHHITSGDVFFASN